YRIFQFGLSYSRQRSRSWKISNCPICLTSLPPSPAPFVHCGFCSGFLNRLITPEDLANSRSILSPQVPIRLEPRTCLRSERSIATSRETPSTFYVSCHQLRARSC